VAAAVFDDATATLTFAAGARDRATVNVFGVPFSGADNVDGVTAKLTEPELTTVTAAVATGIPVAANVTLAVRSTEPPFTPVRVTVCGRL
jgi:hypothetical protein